VREDFFDGERYLGLSSTPGVQRAQSGTEGFRAPELEAGAAPSRVRFGLHTGGAPAERSATDRRRARGLRHHRIMAPQVARSRSYRGFAIRI
jgi:hypothetical protein